MRMRYLIISVLVLLTGCGPNVKVQQTVDNYMKANNCAGAIDYLKTAENSYGGNQRLLYLMDSAMTNLLCEKYAEGNNYFHSAEDLAEDLYTKSISKEAASFLVNDYTIAYPGEDFERALINMFSAVNYLMLGQRTEALVECRRLDAVLSMYNEKYETKNVYKEDGFGRYLSATIYESNGNLQDAFIDYTKAVSTYKDYGRDYGTKTPAALIEDALRVAEALGKNDELNSLKQAYPSAQWKKQDEVKGLGKVVFIHFNGRAPFKTSRSIHIPSPSGPITLAFPGYLVDLPKCQKGVFYVESGSDNIGSYEELAEDINKIAVKNLDDRKGRIIAKGVARAAIKQVALHAATSAIKDENVRQVTRIFGNIANTQIEKADTRSWQTLPGEIYISRVFVPAGEHKLFVDRCNKGKDMIGSINIAAGETKYILYKTMY